MKKIAFALTALITLVCAFAGCSSDPFEAKRYVSDDAISAVSIDVIDRAIEIGVSDDERVRIDYFDGTKEFCEISVTDEVLSLKLATDKDPTDFVGTKPSIEYRKIRLEVPNGLANLEIATTNETISVSDVAVSDKISLRVNGGDISFERIGGNAIELWAKNGNISGTVTGTIDDYAITCEIKKGDTNLTDKANGDKTLHATNNNGDINVTFTQA